MGSEAKAQGAVLSYGNFITIAINFIIVAFVMFLVVKAINKAKRLAEEPAAAADTAQKPAEAAKPAEELPAEAKAFNAASGEKDPLKRVTALEKFVADHPKASPMLVSQAKALISSS